MSKKPECKDKSKLLTLEACVDGLTRKIDNIADNVDILYKHNKSLERSLIDIHESQIEVDEEKYSQDRKTKLTNACIKGGTVLAYAVAISLVVGAVAALLRPFIFGVLIDIFGPGVTENIKSIIQAFKG